MRVIVVVTLVALLGWCGWWWVASGAQRTAWDTFFAAPGAQMEARRDALAIAGFPNRIDTTITNLSIKDRQAGWGWTAPFFQVLMLSYRPTHFIAVWPETQQLDTPTGAIEVTSEGMQASLVVFARTDLALERFRFEADRIGLEGVISAKLGQTNLAFEDSPDVGGRGSYQLLFQTRDLRLGGVSRPPLVLDLVRGEATLNLERPLDRQLARSGAPGFEMLTIRQLSADLPEGRLDISGQLSPDGRFLGGELMIRPQNADVMRRVISMMGADPALAGAATLLGSNITLSLAGGMVKLQPLGLPLGPAPRLP